MQMLSDRINSALIPIKPIGVCKAGGKRDKRTEMLPVQGTGPRIKK